MLVAVLLGVGVAVLVGVGVGLGVGVSVGVLVTVGVGGVCPSMLGYRLEAPSVARWRSRFPGYAQLGSSCAAL